jgi:hypothetical protein
VRLERLLKSKSNLTIESINQTEPKKRKQYTTHTNQVNDGASILGAFFYFSADAGTDMEDEGKGALSAMNCLGICARLIASLLYFLFTVSCPGLFCILLFTHYKTNGFEF